MDLRRRVLPPDSKVGAVLVGLFADLLYVFVEKIVSADVLGNVPVRPQLESFPCRPWLRIRLWVVECNVDLQHVRSSTPDTFDKVQSVRMRMTHLIDPGLVVKSDRIDDKRISFPIANRIPHPGWSGVPRVSSSIREDLAHKVIELVK